MFGRVALALIVSTAALAAAPAKPTLFSGTSAVLQHSLARHLGMVEVETDDGYFLGSGVRVGPRVVLSAAHIVYDDSTGTWTPLPRFAYRYFRSWDSDPGPIGAGVAGVYRWEQYRESAQGEEAGLSSYDTFNLDCVAYYYLLTPPAMRGTGWAVSVLSDPGRPGEIRQPGGQSIIGYPADEAFISSSNIGKLHYTSELDYDDYWTADEEDRATWLDPYGNPVVMYILDNVVVYGGNSGGALAQRRADASWGLTGILVGGDDTSSAVRALDPPAWDLVRLAADQSGAGLLDRPRDFVASTEAGAVRLAWAEATFPGQSWQLRRRLDAARTSVATLGGAEREIRLTDLLPGRTYHFTLAATGLDGTTPVEGPETAELPVETPGFARDLAGAAGAPELALRTTGDAAFRASGSWGGVESGRIVGWQESRLTLRLQGPGTLSFEWFVDSELNPDYNNSGSVDYRQLYDALVLRADGVQRRFLSGRNLSQKDSLSLTAGPHTLEFVYLKDPYDDQGLDLGRVRDLVWKPTTPELVPGAYTVGAPWSLASWWGYHTAPQSGWSYHLQHGWFYGTAPASGTARWYYLMTGDFGWVYTTPALYPQFYQAATNTWWRYLEDTGVAGADRWFYSAASGWVKR